MKGNVANKNNSPVNIRFVTKTSDTKNSLTTTDLMLKHQKWQYWLQAQVYGSDLLEHTQGCQLKKWNGKVVMHQKVSKIKQIEIGKVWSLAQKINWTSIIIFQSFNVIFPCSHDLEKVTSIITWCLLMIFVCFVQVYVGCNEY